jgi:polyhydroxyalkanoate synthesis regulator phasin
MARSQLSILATPELVKRVKDRAAERSLTVTAYVLRLIGDDLDQTTRGKRDDLGERVQELERRLGQLEARLEPSPPKP